MTTVGSYFLGLCLQAYYPREFLGLALLVAGGSLAAVLLFRLPAKARVAALVAALAVVVLASFFVPAIDNDEAEHLHATWLVSQGLLPFRGFWEHHSPLLWIVLAPLVRACRPGAFVCDGARALSLLLALAALALVLRWVRRQGGSGGDRWVSAALWASALVPGELYDLRPDLLGNVLTLGAFLTYLQESRWISSLATGALVGLAAAFSPKHLLFLAVFPAVEYWQQRRAGVVLRWCGPYLLGLAVGVAPLLAWLGAHGLVGDYWHWVFGWNAAARGLLVGGTVPLLPLALAGWWAWTRFRRAGEPPGHGERLLLVGLAAGLLTFCLQPDIYRFVYNLQVFLLLLAVAAAGPVRSALSSLVSRGQPALAGALVCLYLMPTLAPVADALSGAGSNYLRSRSFIASLEQVAGSGPVLGSGRKHPLFRRDAVDLFLPWQWHWLDHPALRARVGRIVDALIATRPTLIVAYPERRRQGDLATCLIRTGVITAQGAGRLRAFLKANYRLVRIGDLYWVRDDRPVPPGAVTGPPTPEPTAGATG